MWRQVDLLMAMQTEPSRRYGSVADFSNDVERYLQGKGVPAKSRVQLFKLAWDMIGEQFGSRQLQYEWFYAGDPLFTRARFYRSPVVGQYKAMVEKLLQTEK